MKLFKKLFQAIQKSSLMDLRINWGLQEDDVLEKIENIVDSENTDEFDAGYYEGQADIIRVVVELLKVIDRPIDTIVEYLYQDEKKHCEEMCGNDFEDQDLIKALKENKTHQDWIASGFVEVEDHIFNSIITLKYLDKFVDMNLFKGFGIGEIEDYKS